MFHLLRRILILDIPLACKSITAGGTFAKKHSISVIFLYFSIIILTCNNISIVVEPHASLYGFRWMLVVVDDDDFSLQLNYWVLNPEPLRSTLAADLSKKNKDH